MKKNTIIQAAILVFVIGIIFVFVAGLRGGTEASIGDDAVDFTLEDLEGNQVQLSDHEGEVVILYFFTTTCKSCEETTPAIMAFEEEYKDKVALYTIVRSETKRSVEKYIDKTGHDLPYVFDFDLTVSNNYGVYGQPETIVINQDGVISNHFIGPISRDVLAVEMMRME